MPSNKRGVIPYKATAFVNSEAVYALLPSTIDIDRSCYGGIYLYIVNMVIRGYSQVTTVFTMTDTATD